MFEINKKLKQSVAKYDFLYANADSIRSGTHTFFMVDKNQFINEVFEYEAFVMFFYADLIKKTIEGKYNIGRSIEALGDINLALYVTLDDLRIKRIKYKRKSNFLSRFLFGSRVKMRRNRS